jgi:BolA protein
MADRLAQLRRRLEAAFSPGSVDLIDESEQHRGHAGSGGGGHYRVTIVSEQFAGQPPLARHRAVYAALGEMLGPEVHALSIRALTPDEERAGPRG